MRGNYQQITICKGQENHAREENIYDSMNFFLDVYQRARDCVEEVLRLSFVKEQELRQCGQCGGREWMQYSDEMLNSQLIRNQPTNIIAFCAERGGGKTTAMVSFADALRKLVPEKLSQEQREFWQETSVCNYTYQVINRIDPTAMEAHDTILRMILSRMFSHFQLVCERRYRDDYSSCRMVNVERERNELAGLFQHCFHNLEVLLSKPEKPDGREDELEHIADLGDSANLRGALYRLIRKYLEFVCPDQKAYLVIQIDDTDLNMDKTYTILEDMRKYLQLPRVLILVAANMTQMECTVEQYFIKKYESSLRQPGSMIDITRCHLIAEQYLQKLIPSFMRVFLPDLNSIIQQGAQQLRINYQAYDQEGHPYNLLDDNYAQDHAETWRYQQQLLYFLHRKTGLIFWAPKNYLHNFLPGTLRELAHFLSLFGEMPDISINYHDLIGYFINGKTDQQGMDALQRWQHSLNKLERYLLNSWSAVNLRKEGAYYLREFAAQPKYNMHRYLLKLLPSYYAQERMRIDSIRGVTLSNANDYRKAFIAECEKNGVYIDESLSSEWRSDNKHVYLSYADVVTALDILTELPGGDQQYKFCYAIHLYYSIYLHQIMLNYFQQKKTAMNLDGFFEDILFRQGGQNERSQHFACWHLSVTPEKIYQVFVKNRQVEGESGGEKKGLTLVECNFLKTFLRVEKKEGSHYRIQPLEQDRLNELAEDLKRFQKRHAQEVWIFNPFYCLLQEWHILLNPKEGQETRAFYQENKDAYVRMHHAMVILLNWDIQNHLLHEYKKSILDLNTGWNTKMQELYEQNFMQRCLNKIAELNDVNIVKSVIDVSYADEPVKNVLYRKLQLCFEDYAVDDFLEHLCQLISEIQQFIEQYQYPVEYDLMAIFEYEKLKEVGHTILNHIDELIFHVLHEYEQIELLLGSDVVKDISLKKVLEDGAWFMIPVQELMKDLQQAKRQLELLMDGDPEKQEEQNTQEDAIHPVKESNDCMEKCMEMFAEKMCDHITSQLSQELVKQWMSSKDEPSAEVQDETKVLELANCMGRAFSMFQAAIHLSGVSGNSSPKSQKQDGKEQEEPLKPEQ